ncbi:MAG: Trm112 family protein [candidate division KSB1 bacterium]|nr:Trm112 family protein [candidate division KSB1 bacterium]MDQ7063149.1 Trm112 family protein [candidate division KSB1 bacterium]
MAVDAKLLEILACPQCKGELEYREEEQVLICHQCKLKYAIRDDFPIMLVDEASPMDE